MADIALMVEGQEDMTWDRFLRFVDAAERLGFDGLFRSDHLTALWGPPTRRSLALWPSLTAVAMRTERIRFGPMVCSITFRHPAMVAKMAASVDQLSGGRLDLGLGAGWHRDEHEMFGIEYPPYGERLDRLDEGASVIRALWSEQPTTLEGRHFSLSAAENHPGPAATGPTLVMGGKGERTLKVVARHATEWNCSYAPVSLFREKSAELDAACEEIDRDPATLRRSLMIPFAIGADARQVQAHIDAHRQTFPALPSDPAGWRDAGFLVGTPDDLVDQIGERVEAGTTRFHLQQNALDDLESVELLGDAVVGIV